MRTTAYFFVLFLLAFGLLPSKVHAQEDLQIDPDSIYHVLAGTSEQMLGDQKVPGRLSVAEWRADLDSFAAAMQRRMPYAEAALGWRALPVWLWRFDDGVHVMAAADEALIGRKVLSIDDVPIDDVYDRLAPYAGADNRWHRTRRIEEQFLRWVNPLHAVGVARDTSGVTLRTRTGDGTTQSVAVPSMRPTDPDWVRFFLSLTDVPPDLQWSPAGETQDNDEPFYRVSYRDSTDLLYVQFNTVLNESDFDAFSGQSIADLADSLRAIVDARPLDTFVLDLRTNTGGDFPLVEPLVNLLSTRPKIDGSGTLYTLISSVTFSAAGVFAMKLERRTKSWNGGPKRHLRGHQAVSPPTFGAR